MKIRTRTEDAAAEARGTGVGATSAATVGSAAQDRGGVAAVEAVHAGTDPTEAGTGTAPPIRIRAAGAKPVRADAPSADVGV